MKQKKQLCSGLILGCLLLPSFLIGCSEDDDDTANQTIYELSGSANAANERQANPVNSSATGNITGTYDESTNTLQYTITWNGLNAPASAMHFHGPATPQQNAGVMIPIPVPSSPPPSSGTVSQTIVLHDSVEAHLLSGKVYYNIHTPNPFYPAGEIRGNILATKRP